jgi:GNAT superfamily N-acetyltransferase
VERASLIAALYSPPVAHEIRRLRPDEGEALLELLDGWTVPDGWRGRDFFRRLTQGAPDFDPRDVWVAAEGEALLSCVQIFPRTVGIRGHAIPIGGIGSVFTHESARGRGVSSEVLEATAEDMRARGMLVSLLFAARRAFYGRLGWRSHATRRLLVSRADANAGGAAGAAGGVEVAPFDPARDLEAVAALHRAYTGARDGAELRDAAAWRRSLRQAGNPREEFEVARRGGEPIAYLRAIKLSGFLVGMEAGRTREGAAALAELLWRALGPRDPDPLASPERPSSELRKLLALTDPGDPELEAAARERGLVVRPIEDPSGMWRCLDAPALARAIALPLRPGEEPGDYLERALPPLRILYWPADRF